MADYSTDFSRNPNWSGEGFQFIYVCEFDALHVTSHSTDEFLRILVDAYAVTALQGVTLDAGEHKMFTADNMESFLFMKRRQEWPKLFWIRSLARSPKTNQHEVEVDLYAPNRLSVGGPSYWFYHGSRKADLSYAKAVARVVKLGVAAFGPGYGHFAADGYCEEEVARMRRDGKQPNVTSETTCEELAEYIVAVCDDTRLRG